MVRAEARNRVITYQVDVNRSFAACYVINRSAHIVFSIHRIFRNKGRCVGPMALWPGIGPYFVIYYYYKQLLIHAFCVGLSPLRLGMPRMY